MPKIEDIDRNFKIKTLIEKENLQFYDCTKPPFRIYGVFVQNNRFRRMPDEIAKEVSEDVYVLHTNTAGGRVRFITDSEYIAIHAVMDGIGRMPHFALTGSAGFDLYETDKNGIDYHRGTFVPPYDITDGYESIIELGTAKRRLITINFPLYSNVLQLYIGVSNHSVLEEAPEYKIETPVVYYGSSITQGGCASRPGTSYQSIISRKLNCNFINLGFSGACKGEDAMIDYINKLNMSAFVYDYDHNAPTPEHLLATHEKGYKKIRKEHSQLPIIFLTRPKYYLDAAEKERFDIIYKNYEKAKSDGDDNLYFIDGRTLMDQLIRDDGTVDQCHPTDSGFFSMANVIAPVLAKVLNIDVR